MNSRRTLVYGIILAFAALAWLEGLNAHELITSKPTSRIGSLRGFFGEIKKSSARGLNYLTNMLVSIPFTKIIMAGGALLSLFFIFVRLIIVLGPIMILGAMTRDGTTDASDLLKMLIEFYNQIVVALDEQYGAQPPPSA